MLGLPPVWYKAPPYRSRAIIDPRGVLAEFGLTLDPATAIRVWDSTAELRYLVVPMRPAGSEGLDEAALADLVTRDSMIGTGLRAARHERAAGSRRADGLRAGRAGGGRAGVPCRLGAAGAGAADRGRRRWGTGRSTRRGTRARACRRPTIYASSYYAIWIKALERLLVRHGFVTEAELAAGHALVAGRRAEAGAAAAPRSPALIARGAPYDRDPRRPAPAFAAGDRVRTVVMHPPGHTRLPRYARGKPGRIEAVQGFHVLPDSNAHGRGEAPEWLYTVVFDARASSGASDGDPNGTVSIDAWESYLERA